MKPVTKKMLYSFIDGIPPLKRKLDIEISNINDERRLIEVAVSLLDNNDSIETDDIRSICEEIGGTHYKELLNDEKSFNDFFAKPIYSRIDNVKNIIDVYRNLKNNKKEPGV